MAYLIYLQEAVFHPSCERVYITRVYKEYPADTFFTRFESSYDIVRYGIYVKVSSKCPILENNVLFTRFQRDRVNNLLFFNIGQLLW